MSIVTTRPSTSNAGRMQEILRVTGGGGTWKGVINVPTPLVPPIEAASRLVPNRLHQLADGKLLSPMDLYPMLECDESDELVQTDSHLPLAVSSERPSPAAPTAPIAGAPCSPFQSRRFQTSEQAATALSREEEMAEDEAATQALQWIVRPSSCSKLNGYCESNPERSLVLQRWAHMGGYQFFIASQKLTFAALLLLRSPVLAPAVPVVRALPPLTQAIMLRTAQRKENNRVSMERCGQKRCSLDEKRTSSKEGRQGSAYGVYGRASTDDSSLSAPLLMLGKVGSTLCDMSLVHQLLDSHSSSSVPHILRQRLNSGFKSPPKRFDSAADGATHGGSAQSERLPRVGFRAGVSNNGHHLGPRSCLGMGKQERSARTLDNDMLNEDLTLQASKSGSSNATVVFTTRASPNSGVRSSEEDSIGRGNMRITADDEADVADAIASQGMLLAMRGEKRETGEGKERNARGSVLVSFSVCLKSVKQFVAPELPSTGRSSSQLGAQDLDPPHARVQESQQQYPAVDPSGQESGGDSRCMTGASGEVQSQVEEVLLMAEVWHEVSRF